MTNPKVMYPKIKGRIPELIFEDAFAAIEASDRIAVGTSDFDQGLAFSDIDARVNHETRERVRQKQEKKKTEKKIKARKKKGKKKRFTRPSAPRPRSRPSHAR